MLSSITQRKRVLAFLTALIAPPLAVLLRMSLEQRYGHFPPYVLLFLIVLLVAILGDAWAGLLATATTAAMFIHEVFIPRGEFKVSDTSDVIGLVIFCAGAIGICFIADNYQRKNQRLARYRKELAVYEAKRRSEERFRAMVDATSDVVYSMSPNWSEMHELEGKGFLADTTTPTHNWLQKYVHPDDQPRVMSVINEAMRTKSAFELENRVIRADGSLGWTFTRAIPLLDANGEITEWFGAASDITRRKKAEEVWRNLSAIVESSYDAIIGKTLDGTITSWNPGAERLYGYSAAEMVGLPISLLVPSGYPDDVIGLLKRVANREYIEDHQTVRQRKDGSLVEVSLRISPILDGYGNVAGASTIARDITARKRAQEVLLRNEKLTATARLATTIAHELNNPLAGAINAIYIANTIPARASEMLKIAEQELRRAAHIVQQTLGFYRESGGQRQVPIREVIDQVLSVYATKLRNRSVTVQQRYSCGCSHHKGGCADGCEQCEKTLLVPAGDLRQIISNLLANGIDAIADGGVMLIRVSAVSGRIQLTMADNGCGIRTENLKRIFEPFFTTKEAFGTGLGLWVTRELVRKHNGAIKVRSVKNKGTIFRLTFPQQKPHEDSHVDPSPKPLARVA